jgi:hypothetical protein
MISTAPRRLADRVEVRLVQKGTPHQRRVAGRGNVTAKETPADHLSLAARSVSIFADDASLFSRYLCQRQGP